MSGSRLRKLPLWCRPAAAYVRSAWSRLENRNPSRTSIPPSYCRALAGESDYNICINSDLTVSCNCHDYDGRAHIGDLNESTLEEIFAGPLVARYQEALSKGRLPLGDCARCPELSALPGGRTKPVAGAVPRLGVMIENTARCNLKCPGCQREQLLNIRSRTSMALHDLERVVDMLAASGVGQICYFNLGEPFLSRTVLEEIKLIRAGLPGVRLVTSTNGVLLEGENAVEAALMMDHIFFSIDGVDQQTIERYQRGGDFSRSYGNMRQLVVERNARGLARSSHRPFIEWKYVMFRWNDRRRHLERALRLAHDAKVDRLTFVPGTAPLSDMSLRYFGNRLLQTMGSATESGTSFNVAGESP